VPKAELKKNYWFVRVRDPKYYSIFRTKDIGRPHHTLMILGKSRSTGKWVTQAWRFHKDDVKVVGGRLVSDQPHIQLILDSLPRRSIEVRKVRVKKYRRRI